MPTYYATKWVETKTFWTKFAPITTKFLYEYILTHFGCLKQNVTNQGTHFINEAIQYFVDHFLFKHTNSTTYYPWGNGQAKSTNKVIGTMLTKLVNDKNINKHTF